MIDVPCPIFENAKAQPHHGALVSEIGTWSYLELSNAIDALCCFLRENGIKEHQRIAFIARTHPSTILLFFALFRLGAIACPLSFRSPAEQISKCVGNLKTSHFLDPTTLPTHRTKTFASQPMIPLDASATLLFTSGSSGNPKAACHTYANHYYNALGATTPLQLNSSSRWLLSLPLFHVSGLGILFRCFQKGACVVLSNKPLAQAIFHHQITHISLVPTQLYRLIQESNPQMMKSLRSLLLGGAPLPLELIRRAHAIDLPVFTTYGMTEMSSIITLSDSNLAYDAGKLMPHREMKIDEDHQIWVRGKTLFEGYWDPKRESLMRWDSQEWFPTRDTGRWTQQGNLEITGRKDRLFISGGENIQPEEIEKALQAIPGIRQATVLPIDDPEFGQRPIAFIDDETSSHTLKSICKYLSNSLPSFKHPIQILPYPANIGFKPNLNDLIPFIK